MRVSLLRVAGGFVPAAPIDEDGLSRVKIGEVIECTFKRVRNGGHHRKLFALLHIVLQNSDRYATIEHLLTELKLQTGHYEEHVTFDGDLVLIPKSISFADMDQDEFAVFYDRVVDVVVQKLLPGTTEEELERQLNTIVGFM